RNGKAAGSRRALRQRRRVPPVALAVRRGACLAQRCSVRAKCVSPPGRPEFPARSRRTTPLPASFPSPYASSIPRLWLPFLAGGVVARQDLSAHSSTQPGAEGAEEK